MLGGTTDPHVQDHNKRNALYKLPVNGQGLFSFNGNRNVEEPFINSSGTYVGFRGKVFNAAEAFVSPLEKSVQTTDYKGFPNHSIKVETIQWTSSDGE
jgi:hypothetical protein